MFLSGRLDLQNRIESQKEIGMCINIGSFWEYWCVWFF